MNPTAPVWVSTAGSGGASPPRSTLDPNTAEFHPKAASSKHPPSQPSSFTKYVGNPVISSQAASGGGGGAAGHHHYTSHPMGYHHHHVSHGPRNMVGAAVSGGAAGFPVSRAHPAAYHMHTPPGGGPRHPPYPYGAAAAPHQHHYAHQSHHQSAGGRGGSGGVQSTSNVAGMSATQLYSAKANTHWGSAGGPPSNMQQTHHASNGAVLYNQHARGRGGTGGQQCSPQHQQQPRPLSPPAHHHSSSGDATHNPSNSSSSSTPQNNKSSGLHEDVLFTPSTRGIWSGGANGVSGGDTSYTALLLHSELSGKDGTTFRDQFSNEPPEMQHDEVPSVSAAVNSMLLESLGVHDPETLSHLGADAWVSPDHKGNDITANDSSSLVTPWARLLTPPPSQLKVDSGKTNNRAASEEDHVDTVQHLLAQLTKNSDVPHFVNKHDAQKLSPPKPSHHQHADPHTSSSGHSSKRTPQNIHQPPLVVAPPAAIGGSPTSPDMHKQHTQSPPNRSAQHGGMPSSSADSFGGGETSPLVMKAVPRSMQQQRPEASIKSSNTTSRGAVMTEVLSAPSRRSTDRELPQPAPSTTAAPTTSPTAIAATVATPPTAEKSERKWKHRSEVTQLLANAKETMRHIKILSFSKKYPEEIASLFQGWAAKGIPAPDDVFGAYYLYVVKKSGVELCMKHNGRGRAPGVGYGRCDFANRGPNYKCRFQHMCLFCKGEDHGWFDESKCGRFQEFRREMAKAGVSDGEIEELVEAYDVVPS